MWASRRSPAAELGALVCSSEDRLEVGTFGEADRVIDCVGSARDLADAVATAVGREMHGGEEFDVGDTART